MNLVKFRPSLEPWKVLAYSHINKTVDIKWAESEAERVEQL